MSVIWATKEEVHRVLKEKVAPVDVVLDIGPGIRPQTVIQPQVHICVEPYLPYLDQLRLRVDNDPRYVLLNCTWEVAMSILPSKSVDSVFALDVIEHLEKADGLRFLQQAECIARRQIVIFTPLGFFPQSYEDTNKPDRWGMQGGYWQTHRSGWLPEDFGEGWELVCFESYHLVDQDEQPLEKPFGAIWAFRNLSDITPRKIPKHRNVGLKYRKILQTWPRLILRQVLPGPVHTRLRAMWHVLRGVKQ